MADDAVQQWIIQNNVAKQRRAEIVSSPTELLAAEDPGEGQAAMAAVATWLTTEPNLPVVELGMLSPRAVTLTFAEDVVLPEPWVSELGDPHRPHDQWGITHQHALNLPVGKGYAWQISGLTGVGTLADGSRGMVNTCRWEILQLAGTPEWSRNLMITQVMSQAAEPWSAEHDIWLIGFDDTAEKLTSFLANHHPPHRFHTVQALEDINNSDLKGSTATLYVMGSGPKTAEQFKALQTEGVGMITDEIVTDEAMFLSEREGGIAVLGPFPRNLEIWPNLQEDLIRTMEKSWEVNEVIAQQMEAAADFSEILDSEDPHTAAEQKSTEQVNADFEALMAQSNVTPEDFTVGDTATGGPLGPSPAEEVGEQDSKESLEPTGANPPATDEDPEEADDELPAATATETLSTTESAPTQQRADAETTNDPEDTSIASTSSGTGTASSEDAYPARLTVLGDARADTTTGTLTGRHAAALIILEMTKEPIAAQQISETLWPGDDAEGHTARTRRTRLLSKLREHVGDIISITDAGWSIAPGHFETDYDELLDLLTNEPVDRTETIVEACQRISRPLDKAGQWADYYRTQMIEGLTEALDDLKIRAIEAEEFDLAKAAKSASDALGED